MGAVKTGITEVAPAAPDFRPEAGTVDVKETLPVIQIPEEPEDEEEDATPQALKVAVTEVIPSDPDFKPEAGIVDVKKLLPLAEKFVITGNEDERAILTEIFKVGPAKPCEEPPHAPCGRREIKDIVAHARMSIHDFLAIVKAGEDMGVGIDEYVQLAEYLYGQFYLSVDVFCANGAMMLHGGREADAFAVVRLGDEDVTSRIPPEQFSWERSSGSQEQDAIWNMLHDGVGPRIHVTAADVNGSCTFYCIIPVSSIKNANL